MGRLQGLDPGQHRRLKRRLVFLLAAASGAAACGNAAAPEDRGRGAFAAYNCRQCHRIGDSGGTTGPDLTFVGFRETPEFLETWLKDPSGWQPTTMMPNFHFNDATRKDLAAYLSTLKGQAYKEKGAPWNTSALRADAVKRGAAVFLLAGCWTCHGKGGSGGYRNDNAAGGKVPALTGVAASYSKAELIAKITRGVRRPAKADPAGPEPPLFMPAWGEALAPDEIEAVADYLLSLRPKGSVKEDF